MNPLDLVGFPNASTRGFFLAPGRRIPCLNLTMPVTGPSVMASRPPQSHYIVWTQLAYTTLERSIQHPSFGPERCKICDRTQWLPALSAPRHEKAGVTTLLTA